MLLKMPVSKKGLPENLWPCLLNLMTEYFRQKTIDVFTISDITPLIFTGNWTVFISSIFEGPQRPVNVDALFFLNDSADSIELWGRYDRVAVVANEPLDALPLLKKSRLVNTVVLIPENSTVVAYTWFPYNRRNCWNSTRLQAIAQCSTGKWSHDLYPDKVPSKFSKCPVHYRTFPWKPDILETSPGEFSGREVTLMNTLAESLDLKVVYPVPTSQNFFFIELENGSAFQQVRDGDVDFVFATLSLVPELNHFAEPLPVYRDQPIVWMFPKAKQKDPTSGIYSGFSTFIWSTIALYQLLSAAVTLAIYYVEGKSLAKFNWLNLVAIQVALPVAKQTSHLARAFLFHLQVGSLHIAWFYQSTLLYNLYHSPKEKEITSVREAVDAGLTVYLYDWMLRYFNESSDDSDLWKIMLSSDRHIFEFNTPLEDIVEKKESFMLVNLVNVGYDLRHKYGKNLPSVVNIQNFLNNPVTAYGRRGSPLTSRMREKMLQVLQSGIFHHWTDIEPGYSDWYHPPHGDKPEVLKFEPLQKAFILYGFLCLLATTVFVFECLAKKIMLVCKVRGLRRGTEKPIRAKRLKNRHNYVPSKFN